MRPNPAVSAVPNVAAQVADLSTGPADEEHAASMTRERRVIAMRDNTGLTVDASRPTLQ
jgi:hypothetical protein